MFKSRNLYNKNIYDNCGKNLGKIKDIFIDFINGKVSGFLVTNFNTKKDQNIKNIYMGEINADSDKIKINIFQDNEKILFSDIRKIKVIDKWGNEKGVINDIMIDEKNFKIRGLILKNDKINTMSNGNEIILIKDVVIEKSYISYIGEPNIVFKNVPQDKKCFI